MESGPSEGADAAATEGVEAAETFAATTVPPIGADAGAYAGDW